MKRLIYVLFFVLLAGTSYAQRAKYVFYFIGDGMGVNQVNGTEMYLAEQEGRIGVKPLLFTTFPAGTVAFRDRFFSSRYGACHRCKDIQWGYWYGR